MILKYLHGIALMVLALNYCSTSTPVKTAGTKSSPTTLSGDWYDYDLTSKSVIYQRPLFGLRRDFTFLDPMQYMCRLEKRNSGEIVELYPPAIPFVYFPDVPTLRGCPTYHFLQEGYQIRVTHVDGDATNPPITISLKELDPQPTPDGKQVYLMYLEIPIRSGMAGTIFAQRESVQAARRPVVRILTT
jgi:hypothetical protein